MLLRLFNKLMGWDEPINTYWKRFILPQVERAEAAGISQERIGEMLKEAIDKADFSATFPRGIFRDLINAEIKGDK